MDSGTLREAELKRIIAWEKDYAIHDKDITYSPNNRFVMRFFLKGRI